MKPVELTRAKTDRVAIRETSSRGFPDDYIRVRLARGALVNFMSGARWCDAARNDSSTKILISPALFPA